MEMDRVDWQLYAILRAHNKKAAEDFRRLRRSVKPLTRARSEELVWKLVPDYRDDYDGHLEKVFIPRHMTQTEWDDLADRIWIRFRQGPFDCTGHPFTTRVKRFTVPGGTWVYHWICYDV